MLGIASVFILAGVTARVYERIDLKNDLVHKKVEVSTVTWVTDQEAIDKAFSEFELREGEELLGLATVGLEDGTCIIYAPLPRGENDSKALDVLGHEMLHCFAGQFHD